MGRLCAVRGCPSGSWKDRQKRKSLHLRSLTIFSVPKCKDRLTAWSQSLGIELRPTQHVCELHFDEKYIKKYDSFNVNGNIHKIPRILWVLADDAVPYLDKPAVTNKENDQTVNTTLAEFSIKCDENQDIKHTSVNNDNVVPGDIDNVDATLQNDPQSKEIHVAISTNSTSVDSSMECEESRLTDHRSIKNESHPSNDIQDENVTIRDDSQLERIPLEFTSAKSLTNSPAMMGSGERNTDQDDISIAANDVTMDTDSFQDDPQVTEIPFNFEVLKEKFESLQVIGFPPFWTWSTDGSTMTFTLYDRNDKNIRLHLIVASDLSLTVLTKTGVLIDLQEKLLSLEDVKVHLAKAQRYAICNGTGIENEKSHPDCEGLVPKEEYLRSIQYIRCANCRALRRKLYVKKPKDVDTVESLKKKIFELRKERTCMLKKNVRLKLKTESLKSQVELLHLQCIAKLESSVETAISELPEAQKEVIRICLATSKDSSPNAHRYPSSWISQCVTIRKKSVSVYEHLRRLQILPLPCRETLIKFLMKNVMDD